MKKTLLLLSLVAAVITAQAQVTWFSQMTGVNVVGPSSFGSSGYGAVRTDDGRFLAVALSDGGGLEMKEFAQDGALMSDFKHLTTTVEWTSINSVSLMDDGAALLVSGLMYDPVTFASNFILARIDISSLAVTYVRKSISGFSYTSGPDVSVASDGVYAIFPDYSKVSTAKFDFSLNPVWNRCEEPGGDTIGGKFPSMGGSRCDSGIVVTCKDDSSYGQSRFGFDGTFLGYTVYRGPGYVRVYNLTSASDGNLIIAGLWSPIYASGWDSRPLIGKMTPSGSVIWMKVLDKYDPDPSLRRFVDVKEAPDGKIYAFGSLDEAYNNTYFDGVCVFDQNGYIQSAKRFGNTDNLYYMYDAKVYSDGILMSGTHTTVSTTTSENILMFTSTSFDQVCAVNNIVMTVDDHDLGPQVNYGAADMTIWSNTPPVVATMSPLTFATDAQPVSCSKVTGVKDASTLVAGIFPNPVNAGELVNVQFSAAGNYTLSVVDMTGKTILSRAVTGTSATLPVGEVAPGIYTVTVRDAGALVSTQKLVVR